MKTLVFLLLVLTQWTRAAPVKDDGGSSLMYRCNCRGSDDDDDYGYPDDDDYGVDYDDIIRKGTGRRRGASKRGCIRGIVIIPIPGPAPRPPGPSPPGPMPPGPSPPGPMPPGPMPPGPMPPGPSPPGPMPPSPSPPGYFGCTPGWHMYPPGQPGWFYIPPQFHPGPYVPQPHPYPPGRYPSRCIYIETFYVELRLRNLDRFYLFVNKSSQPTSLNDCDQLPLFSDMGCNPKSP
ncbi:hypothetical protein HNY73_009763 [Argiope bruennichi]|uniref:Uncharacterized protein n=1 Tax=Argiope bruennichi TaxID=94029 RepID=A0A8T0FH87_ARGBR|nr:hypothetical protein HNY73_009763 [Argiope bruennichi]